MAEPTYDETDRRLTEALQNVEIPVGLHARLHRSLQIAAHDLELEESGLLAQSLSTQKALTSNAGVQRPVGKPSRLLNRRTAIGAALAASVGGVLFGYRQMTQPLSQSWLIKSTQSLLAQVEYAQWHTVDEREAVTVKQSLQDIGFLRQVHGIALLRACELQPPRDVTSAKAYDLGNDLRLLELVIDRGVHGVSQTLTDLAWSRSDAIAMVMGQGNRTLVFTGPASIHAHILRPRTT